MTEKAKIDFIVKTYLAKCTDKLPYRAGKPNPEYYRMRNFILNKQFPVTACYEYAQTLTQKQIMSFTEFINNADKYRVKLIEEVTKQRTKEIMSQPDVKIYKPFSLADLDNL